MALKISVEDFKHFKKLSEDDKDAYWQFARGFMNKLLHQPTVRLKNLAEGSGDPNDQRIVRDLFHLDEGDGK